MSSQRETHVTIKNRPAESKKASQRKTVASAELDALIEEATVDAYGESEQATGFYTMFEEHLAVPFKTDEHQIVAVCVRGRSRQRLSITELPLPASPPKGWDWIDAYRRWARGR
jgi:hypothetical protein